MIEMNDTTMSTITNKLNNNSTSQVFKSKSNKNGKIPNNNTNNVSAKVNDYRKVKKNCFINLFQN